MNGGSIFNFDAILASAGARIHAELEPMTGPRTPVKSAVYSGPGEGTRAYPFHDRPSPSGSGVRVRCSTLLSDEASRNLAEAALLDLLPDLRSLQIVAPDDADQVIELPVDVLELPHSVAAGHLLMTRAVDAGGVLVPFKDSVHGRSLYASGVFDIAWLYEHVPGFVISGFWFSQGQGLWPAQHPNSKVIASTRLPVTAFGVEPMDRGAGAIDPIVLSTDGLVLEAETSSDEFGVRTFKAGKGGRGEKNRLSAIGLGSIAPTMRDTPWVTAESIDAAGMVSFTTIRRLRAPKWNSEQSAAAHRVLSALVLLGTVAVLDDPNFRSGCELVLTTPVTLQALPGDHAPTGVTVRALEGALRSADEAAQIVGLPSIFAAPEQARLPLIANQALLQVLENSRNKAASTDSES